MKKSVGKKIIDYPMPMSIVGSKIKNKENFIAVAWFSMVSFNPLKVAISLGEYHYSNIGIKENRKFSLCIPSVKDLEKVDYIGLVSGEKVDKSKVFKVFYGENDVPMVEECKVNVECSVDEIIKIGKNELIIGNIENVYIDEDILDGKNIDSEKFDPILLFQNSLEYKSIGKKLGKAWNIGKNMEEKK